MLLHKSVVSRLARAPRGEGARRGRPRRDGGPLPPADVPDAVRPTAIAWCRRCHAPRERRLPLCARTGCSSCAVRAGGHRAATGRRPRARRGDARPGLVGAARRGRTARLRLARARHRRALQGARLGAVRLRAGALVVPRCDAVITVSDGIADRSGAATGCASARPWCATCPTSGRLTGRVRPAARRLGIADGAARAPPGRGGARPRLRGAGRGDGAAPGAQLFFLGDDGPELRTRLERFAAECGRERASTSCRASRSRSCSPTPRRRTSASRCSRTPARTTASRCRTRSSSTWRRGCRWW